MSVKRLLPNQRIADANGLPSREFVEIVQRIVGRLPEIVAEAETYADGLALGVGQTWQNVSASRTHSTSYQNTTGRPIEVSIRAISSVASARAFEVSDDGSAWVQVASFSVSGGPQSNVSATVPAGYYYRINGSATISVWAELR